MIAPEFTGETADDIAEQVGLWLRDARSSGADVGRLALIIIKTADGHFKGQVGTRGMLILQVYDVNPDAGARIAEEIFKHRDRLAIYAIDQQTNEGGLSWLDPLPNTSGGDA